MRDKCVRDISSQRTILIGYPQMEVKTNEVHLGNLPSELINYILKLVVSKELDLRLVAISCR